MTVAFFALRELLASDDAGDWGAAPQPDDAIGVLRAGNLRDDGRLDLADLARRSLSARKAEKLRLRRGDIILERSGGSEDRPVGRVVYVAKDLDLVFTNFLHRLRANRDLVEPEFLFYLLHDLHRKGLTVPLQTQTTGIRNLMFQRYLAQRLPVPPLANQRKFLSVLQLSQRNAVTAEDVLSATRELRRGLIQELVTGRRRLARHANDAPWKSASLSELLTVVSEPVEWSDDETYRLVSIRRRNGGLFLREIRPGRQIKTKSLFTIRAGDFLISRMQAVHGAMAVVPQEYDGHHVSGMYFVLRPKTPVRIRTPLLHYIAHLARMYQCVLRASHGVHIEKMTFDPKKFMRTVISIPPGLGEQDHILKILHTVEARLSALDQLSKAFEMERRALMQRLLTGTFARPIGRERERAHA